MSPVANFIDDARDVLLAPLWPVFNRYVKAKRTISEAIQGPQHPTPPFNKTFPAEAVDTYLDYLEARSTVASLECEYWQSMKRLKQDAYRNRLVSSHEARARNLVSAGMKRKQRLALYFEQEIAATKAKQDELERALASRLGHIPAPPQPTRDTELAPSSGSNLSVSLLPDVHRTAYRSGLFESIQNHRLMSMISSPQVGEDPTFTVIHRGRRSG